MYIETHRQRLSRLRGGVGGDAETHKVRRYPRHERKQQRPRESRDTERGPKWTRERRGSCTHRQLSVSGRDQEHRDTGTHTFAQSKVKLPGTQDRRVRSPGTPMTPHSHPALSTASTRTVH